MLTSEQRARRDKKSAKLGDKALRDCKKTIKRLPKSTPLDKVSFGIDLLLSNSIQDFDWFTVVKEDGEYFIRPRYESYKWFLQRGWSFKEFRVQYMNVWDPSRHWMDWLSICLALVSTHRIPRIGAQSPIRVLPLDLIRRLKGFLFEPFPDRRLGQEYPLCSECDVHPTCKGCDICLYCSYQKNWHCESCDFAGPPHLRCVGPGCLHCFECGDDYICHGCKRCSECIVSEEAWQLRISKVTNYCKGCELLF
jgi:hypothetical protein